jgi:hypothetical protein
MTLRLTRKSLDWLRCKRCEIFRYKSEFAICNGYPSSWCRDCVRIYHQEKRKKVKLNANDQPSQS